MTQRRYDDEEVRRIFGEAAERSSTELPAPPAERARAGLTLVELQRIGREVGLDPDRIADAAARLDMGRDAVRGRNVVGLPISVGRGVPLPRALTDDEWSVLVSAIRETFGARGRLHGQGEMREWTNGNLHVFHEATEDGHRLRMRTHKESAAITDWIGLGMLGLGIIVLAVLALSGRFPDDLAVALMLGGIGIAALGTNAFVLPRWARQREGQMEYIAARALALASGEE